MSNKSHTLFWITSALALGAASPTLAQQQTEESGAPSEEIVVTASGREALIQDVPIAVTALDGEAIEKAGITDVRALEQLAPSFKFYTGQSNASGTTAYIRGVGTGSDNPGFESAVGFFVDGVYRNRSGVALSELPEVTRVEVLRGPQGTLFGRNTSAGTVSVITAGPEFEHRRFGLMEMGNLGLIRGQAGATGPIIQDQLAYRIDIGGTVRDGYIEDVRSGLDVNDRNRWNARGQLLWEGDNGSIRVIADTAHTDEQCCQGVTIAAGPIFSNIVGLNGGTPNLAVTGVPSVAQLTGAIGLLTPNPEARRTTITPGRDVMEVVDEWGISGQVDWDIHGMDFTSITSFRDWRLLKGQDVDFNDVDRAYRGDVDKVAYETFSQEFRLHGENGPLDWLVGVFYLDEKAINQSGIRLGKDGALYNDVILAGNLGAQLFGTLGPSAIPSAYPNFLSPTLGIPANFVPNLIGAAFLPTAVAGVAGDPTYATADFQTAIGALALDPRITPAERGQVVALYNGINAAFIAGAPREGQGQTDRFETDTQAFGLFTHNQISLSDQLTLTLGARYNQEEKVLAANLVSDYPTCAVMQSTTPLAPGAPSINQIINSVLTSPTLSAEDRQSLGLLLTIACNPVVNTVANGAYASTHKEEEWTGTASLAYAISDDLMVYGGYSRGYKAGGYNLDRSGFTMTPFSTTRPSVSDLEFAPEFVDSFEAGWKWTFAPRATLNGAIFHQKVSDYQLNAFSGFNFRTFNIEELLSQGVELDLSMPLTDHLGIQAGVLYNKARYNSDLKDPSNPSVNLIKSGDRVAQAPDWTFTGAVNYRRPFGDGLEFSAFLDGRWNSEYWTQTLSRNPITDNDSFAIINGRIGVGSETGAWGVELFVRNLFDEYYHLGAFVPPEQSDVYAAYPSPPRTYGVTLRTSF